jgi:hypothetical protein
MKIPKLAEIKGVLSKMESSPTAYNWKEYVCDIMLNYNNGMKCNDPSVPKDGNSEMLCWIVTAVRMGLGCKDSKYTDVLAIKKK